MSEVLYLHQTFTYYIFIQCKHFDVLIDMPNVIAGYEKLSDLIVFLEIFIYYYKYETSNFKLSQIVC